MVDFDDFKIIIVVQLVFLYIIALICGLIFFRSAKDEEFIK